jgi:hypothetical protein
MTLAAAAAVAGWGVLRLDVLSKPVLPTVIDAWLDRAGTALALALALASAGLVVWGSGLALSDENENEAAPAATVAGGTDGDGGGSQILTGEEQDRRPHGLSACNASPTRLVPARSQNRKIL